MMRNKLAKKATCAVLISCMLLSACGKKADTPSAGESISSTDQGTGNTAKVDGDDASKGDAAGASGAADASGATSDAQGTSNGSASNGADTTAASAASADDLIGVQVEYAYETEPYDYDRGNYTVTVNYYNLLTGEYQNEKIVKDESLTNLNAAFDARNKEKTEWAKQNLEEYNQLAAQKYAKNLNNGDESYVYYYLKSKDKIMRADKTVVSILEQNTVEAEDVDPIGEYETLNYDTQSGKKLSIYDVVSDKDKLISAVVDEIKKQYPDVEKSLITGNDLESSIKTCFENYGNDAKFNIDNIGITVLFPCYDLADYGFGDIFVTIPYKDHPGLAKETFASVPDEYVIPLYNDRDYLLVDKDGNRRQLNLHTNLDEYNYVYSMGIKYGDVSYTDIPGSAYNASGYLMHTKDKDFLYIAYLSDNDYQFMKLYGLSDAGMVVSDESYNSPYDITPENLDDFVLTDVSSILGTSMVIRHYKINRTSGVPEPITDYYLYDGEPLLSNNEPLGLPLVDEDGKLGATIQIPQGTKITRYRTDEKTYVDLKLSGGKMVRATVDISDWPHRVDGKDIEELFAGVFFAG